MLKLIRNNDENDFKRAKNIADFTETCLNITVTRQTVALARILGEVCSYCSNLHVLRHRLSDIRSVVLLNHGVCPKCGATKHDQVSDGYWNGWNQASLAIGLHGGKATSLAILSLYHEHKMLTLNVDGVRLTPWSYYGFDPNTVLHNTLHAGSKQGLAKVSELVQFLRLRSPWYHDYFGYLDELGRTLGAEQYVADGTSVHYKHKNLITESLPNDVRRIRGRIIYFSGLYDFARLQGYDPERVVTALNNCMLTCRNKCVGNQAHEQLGLLVSLTSRSKPRDIFDIMSADTACYSQTFAAWDFNTNMKREDFPMESANDKRDYECLI